MVTDLYVRVVSDYVATVEIRRPPNNYIDADLVGRLATACEELSSTPDCRAIVLCSKGKHFCAGTNHGIGANAREVYEHAARIVTQPLPMVAAVQGAAVGAGLGLAMLADLRVATPTTRFSANFARLGLHHGLGLSVTLGHAISASATADLLLSGRNVKGSEAHRIGLCDRVVDAQSLRSSAHALAAEFARSAPLAVRAIRTTLRDGLPERFREATAHELAEQARLKKTEDWKEGTIAMSDRRLPRFLGR